MSRGSDRLLLPHPRGFVREISSCFSEPCASMRVEVYDILSEGLQQYGALVLRQDSKWKSPILGHYIIIFNFHIWGETIGGNRQELREI